MSKKYIELEAAKKVLADDYAYNAAKLLDTVPTAHVQEVRHGKWLPTSHPDQKRCSVCDVISFIALYPCINRADYCPHCGAKMDGKEDEE